MLIKVIHNKLYHSLLHHSLSTTVLFFLLSVVALQSCSTKRNTWLSRGYQRLSSHYNVYFNATEGFADGLDNVRTAYVNDYSHVLPVYEFSNQQAASAGRSGMEVALKKCHKLIQLHSITVKPERKDNMTEKDRRFYAQEEFNPYVGKAYLLIGKANVILHEDMEAIDYFDYLSRKYEGQPVAYEGKIWKSIAYAQLQQYNNAKAALESYDLDGLAPRELYPDFEAAYANILISQALYAEAIPHMEGAVAETSDRHARQRYTYILAQLYRAVGEKAKAAPLFLALSRSMRDYDMAFAAKLDLATVATTPEELSKAEKTLRGMAKDYKNKDQLDQIFYSIGRMEQNKGNEQAAISAYAKSVKTSVSNDNQKGLSFLALADIFQPKPLYLEASTALDSAAAFLDDANERKAEASKRAKLLRPLAAQLRIVRDNDSLMRIAKMPEKERDKFIADIVRRDEERREAEREAREALRDEQMTQGEYYQLARGAQSSGRSQWYFYNTSLVSAGKSTFRSKWGQRKNEDNWRRSDKSSFSLADASDVEEADVKEAQRQAADAQSSDAPLTKASLMAGLPLSPEAQKKTDDQTALALFNSGAILYNDIQDFPSCVAQLTELMRRFPNSEHAYDALVLLYFAQCKSSNAADASATAADIKRRFPSSSMAKYLSSPSYFAEQQAVHSEQEAAYVRTYEAYLSGRFAEAASLASEGMASSPDAAYSPKYLLIRALSNAKQAQADPFRNDLLRITSDYPGGEEDSVARALLALLDEGKMPTAHQDYASPLAAASAEASSSSVPKVQFTYNPDEPHLVVCFIDEGKHNQALFSVADYNFSNYIIEDFDIQPLRLADDRQAVAVRQFPNAKEALVYFYAIREQSFWKRLSSAPLIEIFVVSEPNLRLLLLSGLSDEFRHFHTQFYAK